MVEAASFFFFKTPDDDVREVLGLPLGDDADDEVVEDDAVCSVVDSRSTGTANFPNIFHVLVGLFRFKNLLLVTVRRNNIIRCGHSNLKFGRYTHHYFRFMFPYTVKYTII